MQKIFLIFHGRFPSEKAAALFAAKSCESFAEEKRDVVLLVPKRFGIVNKDPFEYYNLKKNFTIKYLPTVDLFYIPFFKNFAFYVSLVCFSLSCTMYLFFKSKIEDVIYSNENLPIFFASLFRKNTFFEVHDMPRGSLFFYKKLFRFIKGVIVTNKWKRDNLARIFNVSKEKMLYEMNAVDLQEFSISAKQEEAKKILKIPSQGIMVLYTGHLYSWKGVDTLAKAVEFLSPNITVYFVGGTEKDIADFKKRFGYIPNIVIAGHKNHKEMPLWQRAADVVVVPNTAKEDISKYDTSPMKIFEYMTSKKPIVATDIPSIKEILNNTNSIIVSPDNPMAMAQGIMDVLNDSALAQKIASQAYQDVLIHTWGARAKRVLVFIEEKV